MVDYLNNVRRWLNRVPCMALISVEQVGGNEEEEEGGSSGDEGGDGANVTK